MTDGQKLVTVAYAAAHFKVLPQRIHKYIRDNELKTYEDARSGKRQVDLEEVRVKLENAPARGRPEKKLGSNSVDGVAPGSMLARIKIQEVVRTVHTITSQTEDGIYSLRKSSDVGGFKDVWKAGRVEELMKQDQLFLIDRWAFMAMLAESFEVTGDVEIAEQLRKIQDTEKEASEERKAMFLDEHKGKMIEAEEARKLAMAARKENNSKDEDF